MWKALNSFPIGIIRISGVPALVLGMGPVYVYVTCKFCLTEDCVSDKNGRLGWDTGYIERNCSILMIQKL